MVVLGIINVDLHILYIEAFCPIIHICYRKDDVVKTSAIIFPIFGFDILRGVVDLGFYGIPFPNLNRVIRHPGVQAERAGFRFRVESYFMPRAGLVGVVADFHKCMELFAGSGLGFSKHYLSVVPYFHKLELFYDNLNKVSGHYLLQSAILGSKQMA